MPVVNKKFIILKYLGQNNDGKADVFENN